MRLSKGVGRSMNSMELQQVLENYKKYKEETKSKKLELSNEIVASLNSQFDSFISGFDVEEYRLAGDLMAERLEKNYFKQDEKIL